MNSILRRRRGIMGMAKDQLNLYRVRNYAFDGTASLNTGVCLMDSDKDFTVLADITVTARPSGQYRFFYELEATSPYYGLNINRASSATDIVIRWCSATKSLTQKIPSSGEYKIQIAVTHTAGSGKSEFYIRIDESDSVIYQEVSSAFRTNSTNLIYNGYNDTTRWTGTLNKGDIYNRVLAQAEIYNYFDYDPSTYITTEAVASIEVSGIKQGACTDGTYIYMIVFDTSAYNSGKFVKYKISDGTYTTVTFSGTTFGHGNDMAYNPTNQHIYVACMNDNGGMVEIDTSFNVIQTHTLVDAENSPINVWQICYNRQTNQLYAAQGRNYYVYDQNMDYVSTIASVAHSGTTAQGCETDGTYIYRLFSAPGNTIQVISIATGNQVKKMTLDYGNEIESIMYNWTNKYYFLFNMTNAVIRSATLTV